MPKPSRASFSGLPTELRTRILIDAFMSQVVNMVLMPAAAAVVVRWRRDHSALLGEWQWSQSHDRPGVRPSQLRRISGCLDRMHLEDLCRLALRCDGDVAAALEKLLGALRSAVADAPSEAMHAPNVQEPEDTGMHGSSE